MSESPRHGESQINLLVVDDDVQLLASLCRVLAKRGYNVEAAEGGGQAVEKLGQRAYDVVVTDLRMPGTDGLEVLRTAKALHPETAVLVLTGYATVETAVAAMREGAEDYLPKPPDPEELFLRLERMSDRLHLIDTNRALRRELSRGVPLGGIIGEHPSMQRVYDMVRAVADRDATVLIYGESGTGKELIAKAVHDLSRRQENPFVIVNCAALSSELLENELFGHEKGAYTDAAYRGMGKFEVADTGSLFLDEVGAMGLPLQQKLLRFLQDRSFERVGGTNTLYVDVRVVAATNKDLEQLIAQQQFRDDLFYRLNVVRIDLPLLRERKSDIPLLVQHFLQKYRRHSGGRLLSISPQALEVLEAGPWPGNVRQLENAIERATIFAPGEVIQVEDLPAEIRTTQLAAPRNGELRSLREAVEQLERDLILDALNRAQWNQTRAAESLQINRTTLIEKMRKHSIAQ